jgi:hypothetical protein
MDPKENRAVVKYRWNNRRRKEKGRDPRRREVTKRTTVWRKRRGVLQEGERSSRLEEGEQETGKVEDGEEREKRQERRF